MAVLSRLFGTLLLIAPAQSAAVFDWSQYDRGKSVALAGLVQTVTVSDGVLIVSVSPEAIKGPPRSIWRVVLDTPEALVEAGLPARSLGPGALVQITGKLHRIRPRDVLAQRLTVERKGVILRTAKER